MTAEQELFAVLVALTLFEGIHWIPWQGVAFLRGFRAMVALFPSSWMGNRGGGMVFVPPWPFVGELFVTTSSPLSVSPLGVTTFVIPSVHPSGRPELEIKTFRFDHLTSVEADRRRLLLNDAPTVRGFPRGIAALGDLVFRAAQAPRERRARLLREAMAGTLDPEPVRTRIAEVRDALTTVRTIAAFHLFLAFVLAPFLVIQRGLEEVWTRLLLSLLISSTCFAVGLFFATRRLKIRPPWALMTLSLLYPPAVIHGARRVSRELLADVHPIAMAFASLSDLEATRFVSAWVRDAKTPLPLPDALNEDARTIAAWHHELFAEELTRRLEAEGLDPASLLTPPPAADGCHSYCPRCHATLLLPTGECGDCKVSLEPLQRTLTFPAS